MNKQNEFILTESALEDLQIFKMYMEEKKIYFYFTSYLLFSKTAALCGFTQVID